MGNFRPHFRVINTRASRQIYGQLKKSYQHHQLADASEVIVIGGDGKMLETLGRLLNQRQQRAVYGLNTGHVGFLLNKASGRFSLEDRVASAVPAQLAPLHASLFRSGKPPVYDFAINEVSILRKVAQSAKLLLGLQDKPYIELESCDGVLVATPAGSTAYNRAVGGPIVPIKSDLIALTPINLYRPSGWKGALLDALSQITITVKEADKRPVLVGVDNRTYSGVNKVIIAVAHEQRLTLLFDKEHDFERRILQEQFRT